MAEGQTAQPEAASAPVKSGRGSSITTTVWNPGKTLNREALFNQAKVNTRDAIPVAAYDVDCEVVGTKPKKIDEVDGTAWEVKVTYTPRSDVPPEPVDLERVIKEAQAGYGGTHPGDPDFLG